MSTQRGFTLIETLIYLALFAIVIGGGMVAVYQIVEGSNRNNTKVIVEEEANFLLRKVDWALGAASSVATPAPGLPAPSLAVTKLGFAQNPLVFDLDDPDADGSGNLRLKRAAGTATNLNSSNVTVSNLIFQRVAGAAGLPDKLTTSFTISSNLYGQPFSEDFSTTKFLRQ